MNSNWNPIDHEWSVMLQRVQAHGGGACLTPGEVTLLERHPSYTNPAHVEHQTVSTLVRDFYAAQPGGTHEHN